MTATASFDASTVTCARPHPCALTLRLLPVLCSALVITGCATPRIIRYEAHRYKIDVELDPPAHAIIGHAAIDLVHAPEAPDGPDGPAAVELLLHPDLKITSVHSAGAGARLFALGEPQPRPASAQSPSFDKTLAPRSHVVRLDRVAESLTLFVDFEGRLHQDVSAGEKAGQIHNFEMHAHIGPEGIYLADGYWYPQPAPVRRDMPSLAHFSLTAAKVPDMALVASGDADDVREDMTGKLAWQSPCLIPQMVLVGGKHGVHRAHHQGVDIAVHVSPSNASQAEGLLAAAKKNLDRYVPLMGPYPARQYTIVENFFSSGFAFPCFTLLSSAVIQMGERGWGRHGYLDHEFLHSWWGAGVHVDPRDGNWCESLASYGANYYGFVLDGDEEGARRKRRNICHFLSRIKPEDDKPLSTYELPGGCGRTIAYDKGAMVFHMLERRIGEERFWDALRQFSIRHLGGYASWRELQIVFEDAVDSELDVFFDQWVRKNGAPLVEITNAESDGGELRWEISQSPAFEIDNLMVQVAGPASTESRATLSQHKVAIRSERQILQLPAGSSSTPMSVELDPDYHTLRRIEPDQIIPTTASTRSGDAFTSVVPQDPVPEQLAKLKEQFESSFPPDKRVSRTPDAIRPKEELAERSVLILGDAARDPIIEAFLAAIDFPLRWTEYGFTFENEEFTQPGHAVLCTARHPGIPGGGVTVVYGNSEAALPRAELIPFYENSMVVFDNGVPVLRRDFEPRKLIPVRESHKP